jgi:hypothetical protein
MNSPYRTQYRNATRAGGDFLAGIRRDADDWQELAACRNAVAEGLITDPEKDPFFPKRGDDTTALIGMAYCAECPVRRQCAQLLTTVPKRLGVWGGKLHDTAAAETRLAMYQRGMNDKKIAEATSVTRSAVRWWRLQHKLPPVPRSAREAHVIIGERRRERYDWGWTDQQLADSDTVTLSAIKQWRYRHSLEANTLRSAS